MAKKGTKSSEKKVPAVTDLPTTAKQASDVKGGGASASPALMQACATGSHFKEVTIHI